MNLTKVDLWLIIFVLVCFFIAEARSEEISMPVIVTLIDCTEPEKDDRCPNRDFNDIEPSAEWTPETDEPVTVMEIYE